MFSYTYQVVTPEDFFIFIFNCVMVCLENGAEGCSESSSTQPDRLRFRCDEFYFFTDPEDHIYEHLPDKKAWQLLSTRPISQARFVSLPVLKSPFFNAKLTLKKAYSERLLTRKGRVRLRISF